MRNEIGLNKAMSLEVMMNHFTWCFMVLVCAGCAGRTQSLTTVSKLTSAPDRKATVVMLSQLPTMAPSSGKARVRHLARGHNAYLGHLWIAAGAGVPLHRDPTEEYLYVIEGGGLLTMGGIEYELQPGSAVFMPANIQVQFKNGNAPTVLFQVFAGPESADKYTSWTVFPPKPTQ